jgi:hypothetical protein
MPRNLVQYLAVSGLVSASLGYAQFGSNDWTTAGFDAQRSFWLRGDAKISPESMQKPGFELVWKVNVNESNRQRMLLTPPVLLDFYIGYRGFRSLGFIGLSSNSVVAFDTDLGRVEWKKQLKVESAPAKETSPLCPGGMTAGITRVTDVSYPTAAGFRGFGRGTPAKSGVGEPLQGAVTLSQAAAVRPTPAAPPAGLPKAPTRRTAVPANPFAPRIQWVHALTSDGKLHLMYVSNGEEPKPALSFLPANAHAQGLVVTDNVAYVATANGCGGVANGVWAFDIENQKVIQWKSAGSVVGSVGPVFGPDGTVYTSAGSELAGLEERTLKLKSSYNIGKQEFTSSPVVFEFKGKDLIAATSNDGKLHLLDAAGPTKAVVTTAAFSDPKFSTGALASWVDSAGTRWLLAPVGGASAVSAGFTAGNGEVKNGAIVAWKVVDQNGTPALQPGWISRDMIGPITPIVVNGVIFAVSTGDQRALDPKSSQRPSASVLYALDSATGKEVWNSGKTLAAPVTRGGLAAGGSRVYVATQDGTQYVFGFPIEH